LPTLHEDSEFSYPAVELNKPIPLTHDALMATKNVRMNVESRPVGGLYPRWVIVIECLWKIAWSISFFLIFSFNFCLHFYLIGMPFWFLFQFTYDFVFFFFRFPFILYVHLWGSSRVPHNPYHSVHTTSYYAPYNPVSRQDSEISSDAHTDDTRSLTDGSV
jgi:hypothetical protein